MEISKAIFFVLLVLSLPATVPAQTSEEVNQANNLPLDFGAGKVWKLENGTTLNLFAEPQVTPTTVWRLNFNSFSGLNMQFPIGH